MKVLIVLALATFAYAYVPTTENTAYGYIENYAIPLADRIREAEQKMKEGRIVGGMPSTVGQFPYQAGLLARYAGINGTGVCGGSLVTANRVITAAHCWFDGVNQAWLFTVVLGSNFLFDGGVRPDTSAVALHPNWFPLLARNDVAVVFLPTPVQFSSAISPISLPSGSELQEEFVGVVGVASGFGLTVDDGSVTGNLNHVTLSVISNNVCRFAFPLNLQPTNICTSGVGGASVCRGDSGGPLAITRSGRTILIGVTSFGSPLGCQASMPQAFARVTSFMAFFNQHIQQ